jgi:hypothetical protein
MSVDPEASAWARTLEHLAAVGDRLAAERRARGEPEPEADVSLALLGAVMDSYLTRLCADPDHPRFVPCTGFFQRIGSPNPDTVYRSAAVDPAGVYRLTGERGAAREVTLMPFDARMRSGEPLDLSEVADGADGTFDVVLSGGRPGGHAGHWWPLGPDVRSVWLRTVSDRWGEDREPRIAITREDAPTAPPRPDGAEIGVRLALLGPIVERSVAYGLAHADGLVADGFVNALKPVDYGARGGMSGHWYHEGVFDLAAGEALLVEARLPDDWRYFSWSLTDRMLVTLDWVHAQTSLNRSQATVDPDGVLRVVVSGVDPGVRNWMDTMGHGAGVLQCRTSGGARPPGIDSRVVPVGSIVDHLPPGTERVTDGQRAEALRVRSVGAQHRTLW